MAHPLLTTGIKYLLFLCLLVTVLYFGKPFLAPLVFAGLLSMLLLPIVRKLDSWGWKDGWSALLTVVAFGLVVLGAIYLLIDQISGLASQSDQIEAGLNEKIQELRAWVTEKFGISKQSQDKLLKQQTDRSGSGIMGIISALAAGFGSFMTNLVLVLVYMFLFIFYRSHLSRFLQRVIPENRRVTIQVLEQIRSVAQRYVTGLALMILCLWVMYGIGFSIVGVKHAILFAIVCGLLEIVPFVGNLTGTGITVIATIMQGGSTGMIIGVIGTYGIVQFLQTYFLEPFIVGEGVSINPLMTIAGIVAGELIWGIPGMILAIPLLGIIKIICDHVDSLKPYGMLMGKATASGRR